MNAANDPFSVELPPASTVSGILIVYLVLVVPINLLVLRKMKKTEWAWVTTPLISLGFAGVFFQFAGQLYSASLSVANSGILVIDNRFETGYYYGSAQIFFPRGGRFDLGMKAVESVTELGNEYDFGMRSGSSTLQAMNAIDDGTVRIEGMSANNLSFHEFAYGQVVSAPRWLSSNLKLTHHTTLECSITGTITNRSSYRISGVLHAGSFTTAMPDLEAGQTITIRDRKMELSSPMVPTQRFGPPGGPIGAEHYNESINLTNASPPRICIEGKIEGFRPGPQIGKEVDKYRQIRLIAILSDSTPPEAR
jgi:hypothetical protein